MLIFLMLSSCVAAIIFFTSAGASFKLILLKAVLVGVGVFVVLGGLFTLYKSVMVVDPGHGGVLVWWGTVQKRAEAPGLRFVNPMADRYYLSVKRRTVDFTDDRNEGSSANPVNGPAILITTKDHNLLRVNVSFPYALRMSGLPTLYSVVGEDNTTIETKLIETNARSVLVAVGSDFTWKSLLADNRDDVLSAIHTGLKEAIVSDLMTYGMPRKDAENAVIISPPQIRQIVPSDAVKTAIDEAAATVVLRDRQVDLIKIAESKVRQRELEGQAIEQMFAKLPKGANSLDINRVLLALAAKERADAIMKAIEKDRVQMIIMSGGSGAPAVSLPSGK
jgi:regulator of protease activity HflC (stomatin/prohibitin superfamily)